MRKATRSSPRIGDECFRVVMIDIADVERMAREDGWDGSEGLREFCEPEEAATSSIHGTLEAAIEAARKDLARGVSFYGCNLIDRLVYEPPTCGGEPLGLRPSWERHETYEVSVSGQNVECIKVDR